MKTTFNSQTSLPFNDGDLIVHKTTGAWAVYAGAIQGEALGMPYATHMAYSLNDALNTGKHRIAANTKQIKDYALVDAKGAHAVMQAVYTALGKNTLRLRLKSVPKLKPVVSASVALRQSFVPGSVARAGMDMLGLLHGVENGDGHTYLKEFYNHAYIIAHWTNRIYGVSVDAAYKTLHELTHPSAPMLEFPYADHKVLLKPRKNAVDMAASMLVPPSSIKEHVNIREEKAKPPKRAAHLFNVEISEDFGWFKVETDSKQRFNKHRIAGHEGVYVTNNAMVLLRFLHGHDGFVSFSDILAADTDKLFKDNEKSVFSAYSQLRQKVTKLPELKGKNILAMLKTDGLRFSKVGQDISKPVPKRAAFINQPLDEDFEVHSTADYGAFTVEHDARRRVLTHRIAGKPVYLKPTVLKLLNAMHKAGGALAFNVAAGSVDAPFTTLVDAKQAFRDLHRALDKAGFEADTIIGRTKGDAFTLKQTMR